MNLDIIASFINFGALIAFTFVNISVIAWFFVRQKERSGAKNILMNLIAPGLGMLMTLVLWAFLDGLSLTGGLIWATLGFIYLLFITKGLRKEVDGFDERQPVTGFNKISDDV